MVGIAMVPYAMRSLAGLSPGDATIDPTELTVGVVTLALIMGINVWSRGNFRLYSVLIGIGAGYILAWPMGLLSAEMLADLGSLPLFALPHIDHPGFAFDLSLLMPFLIAALCAALKLIGDLITCQKINDETWRRAEMESVGRGLVADGLGTTLAGLLGGTGLASSSSNIGMAYATGATSRVIGYATGIIFIILAFMPKIAALFSLMPRPIVGAIVIYAACFMMIAGWSIVMTRMLDARKTFTIGLALTLGLSVETLPELFQGVSPFLRPVFDSSIAVAALSAVLLNMLFRIGISSRMGLRLRMREDSGETIYAFFEKTGSVWGARREVVSRAMSAVTEIFESLTDLPGAGGEIQVATSFDEFTINVEIGYRGPELSFPEERPSSECLLADDSQLTRFSGFLVRRLADQVRTESRDGHHRILLRFDH
jgi:NCS2 family nucleobase:cation symporter-2